ncbi:NAD(P)/FAD-dependent oxidoreductase [Chitinophaga varians]|uniref:NAD(P)/FAD-dependent oxidoreductase n=1 Tax=Chitinophaga varians TaxID=2202339 RepID=UPI00165FA118|nr:FAD-dependent oxidoreductase [Chitinophaga varians]MBC9909177.1 FAD-dependent oxidoreductase [Chitinophaga varians]
MKKVIIIGGGMAGLAAARVLSDFCPEILIIERDILPETPETRPGTPQAYHPHHLTPRGRMILEQLFPGLNNELLQNGAASSLGKDIRFYYPFGELIMPDPGNDAACSRPFLEWHIRQRVLQHKGIQLLTDTNVIDLIMEGEQNKVSGVFAISGSKTMELNADLIVVATGFHSRLSDWLHRLDYTIPEPELLTTNLGYSTRHYAVPSSLTFPWNLLHIENQELPEVPTCVVSFMENNVLEIILGNIGGLYPPTDTAGFETALALLNNPTLNELLQQVTPLEAPRGYRIKDVTLRHYEKMDTWPEGLIAIGDAFCTFDPIHGTGMTIAAMQAEMLQRTLQHQGILSPSFGKDFMQAAAKIVEPAWWMNAVSDTGHPQVAHRYTTSQPGLQFAHVFMEQVLQFAVNFHQPALFALVWLVRTSFLSPGELINRRMLYMLREAGLAGPPDQLIQSGEVSAIEHWHDDRCPDIPDFAAELFIPREVLSRQ